MNMRHVIVLALIGVAAPILAHAGDFSVNGAATFAQNIVEPNTLLPAGGDPLSEPATSHGSDFGDIPAPANAPTDFADVSAEAYSGQVSDTASVRHVSVGAAAPNVATQSADAPIEPLDAGKRASYRWQSLVPGVLK